MTMHSYNFGMKYKSNLDLREKIIHSERSKCLNKNTSLVFVDTWHRKLSRRDSTWEETGMRAPFAASRALEYFFRYF
jgi:hypothetical protein